MLRFNTIIISIRNQTRNFSIGSLSKTEKNSESPRMQKFHKQLKLEKMQRVGPAMRFVDLVLVETNPENGELVPNSEKNPTKWGDWQHGGRVTDF